MSIPSAITGASRNPRLRLVNALRSNARPILTFLGLPSVRTAQIVASTGLDGIIIDCEHGNISDDAMHNSVAAIAAQGVSPLVRIQTGQPDHIKRALDAGAHGIVVPMVNTVDDARTVVASSKFPPHGVRGQGSAFPGFAFGVDIPTYMTTADESIIVCVQIESKTAVENVDAIAALPGVDMLFIGPNDLAMSVLGYVPARGDEVEFTAAIDKIVAAARKHGKWVSRLSTDGVTARKHLDVFDCVALSYDVRALQNWYLAELKAARP
jgi:4-hydroxy-2-oxoheptanedioate aldolase